MAKFNVYEMVTERITKAMEAGNIPWHKPWHVVDDGRGLGLHNAVSGHRYQGVNVFLLAGAGDDAFITLKQANGIGGRIRKGSKSLPVVFWTFFDKKDKDGKVVEGQKIPMLRYYNVFRLMDVEGADEWVAKHRAKCAVKVEGKVVEPIAACAAVVEGMPNRPSISHGGNRACYSPAMDAVMVPKVEDFKSVEEYYSTLYHELSHATGHASRLNRDGITKHDGFGSEQYSREELVAELSASFLAAHTGILDKVVDNSAAYVQGWLKALKNDPKMIVWAASRAQKATEYILNVTKEEKEEVAQ